MPQAKPVPAPAYHLHADAHAPAQPTAPAAPTADVLVHPSSFTVPVITIPTSAATVTVTVPPKKTRGSAARPSGSSTRRPAPLVPTDDDTASSLLATAPGDFNLLEALRNDRRLDSAARTEIVRLYNFPAYISLNIRRVLARDRSQRSNFTQALSCLLWHGIARYLALPAVRDFTTALSRLELDDDVPARVAEQIEGWKRGLRFSLGDPTHTMGVEKSRSFRTAEQVHSELFDLAGKLGVPGSVLATMCIVVGLSEQAGVLREHAEYMRAAVDELDEQLADRERRLQGLLGLVESGVWP